MKRGFVNLKRIFWKLEEGVTEKSMIIVRKCEENSTTQNHRVMLELNAVGQSGTGNYREELLVWLVVLTEEGNQSREFWRTQYLPSK